MTPLCQNGLSVGFHQTQKGRTIRGDVDEETAQRADARGLDGACSSTAAPSWTLRNICYSWQCRLSSSLSLCVLSSTVCLTHSLIHAAPLIPCMLPSPLSLSEAFLLLFPLNLTACRVSYIILMDQILHNSRLKLIRQTIWIDLINSTAVWANGSSSASSSDLVLFITQFQERN